MDHPQETISPSGNLSAVDVNTGKMPGSTGPIFRWSAGVLATASDLVFAGENERKSGRI